MTFLAHALGLACIGVTLVPLSRQEAWWVRACDFPRLQIVALAIITAILLATTVDLGLVTNQLMMLAMTLVIGYQALVILPYTRLWPVEVLGRRARREDDLLRLLVVNVEMSNRNAAELLALIREHDPDVLLAVETDAWWCERFGELASAYRHRLQHPLDNTYGMLLYSRLELVEPEIRFLLKSHIPSIRTGVRLRSGRIIRLYGLHPEPPSPTEAESSLPRDAELVLVGREIASASVPTIVAGDLNDVAWSHTSRLFRRISRLLDPRIGRGMYNTFHAGLWPVRWPLDHVFVSEEFALHSLLRLPAFGSDHFPICLTVEHRSSVADLHDPPQPDADDHEEADGKLERAGLDPSHISPSRHSPTTLVDKRAASALGL